MSSNKSLRVALIGAGVRGTNLARQLSSSESRARLVAVAEPREARRTAVAREHALAQYMTFASWEELARSSIPCDAAIIATMDNQHTGPAIAGLQRGCHILIEKPLADTFADCLLIERAQRDAHRVVSVCYTLRYMEAFQILKRIVADGTLGRLIHIEHMEAIGHFRYAHNYVRGRWRKEEGNTNLLLNKCCHDIDFLAWLVDAACMQVSSFGSLSYFTRENAPQGSGTRCLEDCGIADTCPYSVMRLYVDGDLTDKLSELGNVATREDRLDAVRNGPFGTCVWHSDNDVVDHQVVSMEFASGTTATCTMTGYSATHGRRTRIQGTKAELLFDEAQGTITIRRYAEPVPELIQVQTENAYHPEDKSIVDSWISAILDPASDPPTVDASEARETLAIVFAAELSRREHRTVDMAEFSSQVHI